MSWAYIEEVDSVDRCEDSACGFIADVARLGSSDGLKYISFEVTRSECEVAHAYSLACSID
jgi:hypothetical protein